MSNHIKQALETIRARSHTEKIFLQAVTEVYESLYPVIEEYPEIAELTILERLSEPDEVSMFRVTWQADDGSVNVNRGFRVHFNNALGPYKGGLRFHPTVNMAVMKFLAFEQIFKNALTGLPIGGGKGGADFDPKGKSNGEVMRFCQAFMTQLWHHIGDRRDVPAGDIGVGEREIGYLFGQYKLLSKRYDMGVLTGKHVGWGGSLVRKEATGYGCAYFAEQILKAHGEDFSGKTCVVSGSGNVATYAIHKITDLGGKVVSASDSSGTVYDPEGIDFDTLFEVKAVERLRISAYAERRDSAEFRAGMKPWDIPCDCAFPCATQNELDEAAANTLAGNNCRLVCEGANMPCSPKAVAVFQQKGILFAPGKAANAGGVAVSALEMQQNAGLEHWTYDQVDQKLKVTMKDIHEQCVRHAAKYSSPEDYVSGANIAGFLRVADAVRAHGIL